MSPERTSSHGADRADRHLDRAVDALRSVLRDSVHTAVGASLLTANRVNIARSNLRRWLDEADAVELAECLRSEIRSIDRRVRRLEEGGDRVLAAVGDRLPAPGGAIVGHARDAVQDHSAQWRALLGLEV